MSTAWSPAIPLAPSRATYSGSRIPTTTQIASFATVSIKEPLIYALTMNSNFLKVVVVLSGTSLVQWYVLTLFMKI